MSLGAAQTSIWTELDGIRASMLTQLEERFDHFGRQGYVATLAIRPVFDLLIAALIYAGGRRDLVPYIVVTLSANALTWNGIFWVGEILDRERLRGTLVALFLTPCARLSWLLGFAAAGAVETVGAAAPIALVGRLLFDVRFQPNYLTLAVALALTVPALLGLGLILSGFGLLLKKSNELANLVFPVLILLGGVYYPVARLPEALRLPARGLPLGYVMDALTAATLHGASLMQLHGTLLPLAAFAVGTPLLGVLTFSWIERRVRRDGSLDLY